MGQTKYRNKPVATTKVAARINPYFNACGCCTATFYEADGVPETDLIYRDENFTEHRC